MAPRKKKSDEDPEAEVSTDTEEAVDESMLLLTAEQIISMWSTVGGDEEQFRSLFQLIVEIGEQQKSSAPPVGASPRMPVIN